MASTGNGNSSVPSGLCQAGCGFYGNASFGGYCSKCFKEKSRTPAVGAVQAPSEPAIEPLPAAALGESAIAAATSAGVVTAPAAPFATNAMDVEPPAQVSAAVSTAATAGPSSAGVSTPAAGSEASSVMAVEPVVVPAAGGSADAAAAANVQTNKSRCWSCKKKVGLTGFECRCGYTYCAAHRHADTHSCAFDYKSDGRALLEKLNPKVQAAKVEKL